MRTVTWALLVLAALGLVAAPSARADDPLTLGTDGVTWTDAIGQPRFDPSIRSHPSPPDTGSALRPRRLPLALLLLGGGAVLVARRTEDEELP